MPTPTLYPAAKAVARERLRGMAIALLTMIAVLFAEQAVTNYDAGAPWMLRGFMAAVFWLWVGIAVESPWCQR